MNELEAGALFSRYMFLSRPLRWCTPSKQSNAFQSTYDTLSTHTRRIRIVTTCPIHQTTSRSYSSFSSSSEPTTIQGPGTTNASNASKTSRWVKLGITGGVIGVVCGWDHYFNARTLERNTRTVWNGIMLTLDYKYVSF